MLLRLVDDGLGRYGVMDCDIGAPSLLQIKWYLLRNHGANVKGQEVNADRLAHNALK